MTDPDEKVRRARRRQHAYKKLAERERAKKSDRPKEAYIRIRKINYDEE